MFEVPELLTGVAHALQYRHTVRFYWVHGVLTAIVFLALVQQFWEAWGLRDVPEWSFGALLQLLGAPICFYLCARLAFPDPVEGADLEVHYHGAMRPVWILLAIANILATTLRPIAFDDTLLSTGNLASLILLGASALLWLTQHRIVHAVVLSGALLVMLADILIWSSVLQS